MALATYWDSFIGKINGRVEKTGEPAAPPAGPAEAVEDAPALSLMGALKIEEEKLAKLQEEYRAVRANELAEEARVKENPAARSLGQNRERDAQDIEDVLAGQPIGERDAERCPFRIAVAYRAALERQQKRVHDSRQAISRTRYSEEFYEAHETALANLADALLTLARRYNEERDLAGKMSACFGCGAGGGIASRPYLRRFDRKALDTLINSLRDHRMATLLP